MNIKTLFNTDDERAVSPVIGVILMVAITVILAAVIGAFVLDLGQGQEGNVNAGVSFDADTGNDEVTVTVNDMGNADTITVNSNGGSEKTLDSVGASKTIDVNSGGDTVTVVAEQDSGNSNVINTYEYEG
ncbi:type IV pilin [Halostella salina]|uniref:type IV pilin n=1 Tax=Halostella salina TaxID=1547897 RepID=UPI000EF78CE6|nr:type IV pilin N-terminal domain-containing protein [Halostella salina]